MQNFTQSEFFYHEAIRAEQHFRKTMIDCGKDFFGEFQLLEESNTYADDQKQWEILQKKMQNNIDLDLFNEIKKFKDSINGQRQKIWKKVHISLSTDKFKKIFETLNAYLLQANELLNKIEVGPLTWQPLFGDIDTKLRQVWVELKTFNEERISTENHLQNTLIEWISQCVNTLPFWLSNNSYSEFHHIKKIAAIEQNLKEKIQQRKSLSQKIQTFLKNMMDQLKDKNSKIAGSCINLYVLLQKIQENFDTACLERSDWKLTYQELHSELATQRENFFKNIAEISEESLEAVTLYDMQQDAFAQKYQLSPNDFRRAKYIQHQIHVLEKLMQQPDSFLDNSSKPKAVKGKYWLDKKAYIDLLFLLSIVSPEYLKSCLGQKEVLYQEILEDLQNNVALLTACWGEQTQAVTRLHRTHRFYQQWEQIQKQALAKIGVSAINQEENQEPRNIKETILIIAGCLFLFAVAGKFKDDWTSISSLIRFIINFLIRLIINAVSLFIVTILLFRLENTKLFALSRLFTYEKKAFFTEALKKENAISLFRELAILIEHQAELKDPYKILHDLNQKIQLTKTNLDKEKSLIMDKYFLWEKIITFCGLALGEQPTYKVSKIVFATGMDLTRSENLQSEKIQTFYDNIDEVGNRWVPTWIQEGLNLERDLKIIQNFAGLSSFAFDLIFSSLMGYSYRFIAAINNILFSQIDGWVYLANKIGVDEISLLEKEYAVNWLSGLGFHLLFQDRDSWKPALPSYIVAMLASAGADRFIDNLLKDKMEDKEWKIKAFPIIKYVIRIIIYSQVYALSFRKVHEYFHPVECLTPARALETLGFYAQPSQRDLRKRYHELARHNHYDKCITLCHDNNLEVETMATDANIPNCIDNCKTNDQTMREINQAYSYLKSFNK